MNKTKRFKKRLLKKTKKYYGGNIDDQNNNEQRVNEKVGVIDIIKNKVSSYAENTGTFLKDKTLRLFGLQPINENVSNDPTQEGSKIDDVSSGVISNATATTNGILSNAKSIGNDVANVVNKGSAAVIGNINDVLNSPQVENSVAQASQQTAQIGTKLLNIVNNNLNNPEFKEATKEALDNVADYAEISVKALDEPLDHAIDELNQAGSKAAAGVASGAIKVGTDAVAAIPGVGAIVDVGKMINDGTKAASTVVEAGSEAAETASELFMKTNEGIKKGMQELEEKKNEATNIANRTTDSINQFQNVPDDFSEKNGAASEKINSAIGDKVTNVTSNAYNKVGGNRKTKKRLLKRKLKSKKVRFAL